MTRPPKPFPWQRQVWAQLVAAQREDRLGHALLLAGPAGSGKKHFAYCVASALWCRQPDADGAGCGGCPDCRQVQSEAHSGYFLLRVEEDKRDISIEAVRELSEKLTFTAHDGRAKVAVIDPVDALNVNGVNALLKTIEEPSPGSHLLLITERPQALTATLRSRCQRIRLAAPPPDLALTWLGTETGGNVPADHLKQALEVAFGAPLRAAELLADKGLELRLGWQRAMLDLAASKAEPLAVADAIGKDGAIDWLQWLFGWLTMLMRARVAPSTAGDPAVAVLAARLPAELLDRYIAEVQTALYGVRGAADKRLILDGLLIGWLGLLARAGRAPQNAAA